MIDLKTDTLDVLLKTQERLIVMFGTNWCGNCDILKPEFKRLSEQHRDIPFIFINPDDSPISRELIDLTDIPTIVAFKKGNNIGQLYGNKTEVVEKVLTILLG
jgi:thioredoxin 1